jgi:hypothetical protein
MGGSVNDVVVTTDQRHNVLRPISKQCGSDMYLYLVVNKNTGSLPYARMRLSQMENHLAL